MTALIALIALSTYAPATNPFEMTRAPIEPAPALAAEEPRRGSFSYSFIEANYKWTDIDGFGDSLDGWELRASFELPLNIFLQGSYGQLSGDTDIDEWRFGAGWHLPVGQKLDFYGILSMAGTDIQDGDNDNGVAAEVGGRFMVVDKIELNGRVIWADVSDSDGGAGIGGRFYFNPQTSFGLNADFTGDATTYTAGLRFQF
jgi:hypothetical protein